MSMGVLCDPSFRLMACLLSFYAIMISRLMNEGALPMEMGAPDVTIS